MSRHHAAIVAVLALSIPACAQRGEGLAGGPEELVKGTFETRHFESASLGREVQYGIYLPRSYEEPGNTRWYPIAVWLHGMFEDHRRFHSRGGSETLDGLIDQGVVPEMILVSPYGGRSSFYTNGKSSGLWEDMVVKDLMGHLKQTYRLPKDRRYRALMGVSMGGMAALKIGMRHPELFGVVATHSAALFPPDPENLSERFKRVYEGWGRRLGVDDIFGAPIEKDLWQSNSPLHLAGTLDPGVLGSVELYFDCGSRDRYEFHVPNEELHRVLTKRNVKHTWRLVEGAGHSWGRGQMEERLAGSLRFVAAAWVRASKASAPDKTGR